MAHLEAIAVDPLDNGRHAVAVAHALDVHLRAGLALALGALVREGGDDRLRAGAVYAARGRALGGAGVLLGLIVHPLDGAQRGQVDDRRLFCIEERLCISSHLKLVVNADKVDSQAVPPPGRRDKCTCQ